MVQQGGQAFCSQKLWLWAAWTAATEDPKDPCCETARLEGSPEEALRGQERVLYCSWAERTQRGGAGSQFPGWNLRQTYCCRPRLEFQFPTRTGAGTVCPCWA